MGVGGLDIRNLDINVSKKRVLWFILAILKFTSVFWAGGWKKVSTAEKGICIWTPTCDLLSKKKKKIQSNLSGMKNLADFDWISDYTCSLVLLKAADISLIHVPILILSCALKAILWLSLLYCKPRCLSDLPIYSQY